MENTTMSESEIKIRNFINGGKIPSVVKVTDYSDYDPYLCNNGGKYWYAEKYSMQDDGKYLVSYSTSADMQYCVCCGQFGHSECENDIYVSEEELRCILENIIDNEDFEFEVDV